MNTIARSPNLVSRSKIAVMMLACGFAGAASVGAASAAPADEDAPRLTIRFNPQTLETETGARTLYHRIVNAAERVCKDSTSSAHFISEVVQECRKQAIARAVLEIDNPKLAAVHATSSNRG